jgi:aspartate/methionine/tyrosine aminotransferase
MIATSNRLEGIGEYYFSKKLREIDDLNKQGRDIISLGIGSPDLPPHPDVIKVLQEESAKPNVHAYQSYKGSPVLRRAMSEWYRTWYQVDLDPEAEILPLIGSKEGIMHICMTYLEDGDEALIPNPGYPTYSAAVKLAGGKAVPYDLTAENDWQPNFSGMESRDLSRVKLMFVNYPHMPTGKLPGKALFEQLISFASKHNILLVHDNPYSFILNDNPSSLMANPGAKDVALELNSLSKSQNMAGWRVGMVCGAKERIEEVLRFKSNMDSGMFLPLQLAAAKALSLGKDWYDEVNRVYRLRREKVFQLLDLLQCEYAKQQAGMFVWAKIPAAFKSGFELSDDVLYKANVFITPGGIFGSGGNEYIRVSLCSSVEKLRESIKRVEQSGKAIR